MIAQRRPRGERIPFLRQRAGHVIERRSQCPCGAPVSQLAINDEWLGSLGDRARASLLEACAEADGVVYLPDLCVQCARKALR